MTIQMIPPRLIPLDQLVLSPENVRRTNAAYGIEQLATSIKAHGLLQNLQVRCREDGKHEVVAGGRRLAALRLMAKRKEIGKDFAVPCAVLDGTSSAEISLAENEIRLAMHPADQFEAFQALTAQGFGPEEIAARFGTTAHVVQQRLKLAAVSPKLLKLYRAGEMSLDQLMAFTISDDRKAQEAAWFEAGEWNRKPADIRRTLAQGNIDSASKIARFVGVQTYLAAGGGIIRDLFSTETEGYLTDATLLQRLASEKLEAAAAEIQAEGWAWVEIMPDVDYGILSKMRHVAGEPQPYPPELQQELDALRAEQRGIEESDDPTPEQEKRYREIEDRIEAFPEQPESWPARDKARCGAVISVRHDGALDIQRGYLRPEDARREDAEARKAAKAASGQKPQAPGLPSSLVQSLTAHRTAALQALMALNPAVALRAVVHRLALDSFYAQQGDAASALELRLSPTVLPDGENSPRRSRAAQALAERIAHWKRQLPKRAEDLWEWLAAKRTATLEDLLACCAAVCLDATHDGKSAAPCDRLSEDQLATALGLDMSKWWEATPESYLARVPKALALAAVREAVSPAAAQTLQDLKKDHLAARAAKTLAGKGWLPPLLRSPAAPRKKAKARPAQESKPQKGKGKKAA